MRQRRPLSTFAEVRQDALSQVSAISYANLYKEGTSTDKAIATEGVDMAEERVVERLGKGVQAQSL